MNNRREFLMAASGFAGTVAAQPQAPETQPFRAGVCVGAAGESGFLRICDECSQLGFHYIESSGGGTRLADVYAGRGAQLKEELEKRGLTLAGYAQYSLMSDPAKQSDLIELHLRIGRLLEPIGTSYITQLWTPPPKPNIPPDQLWMRLTRDDFKNFAKNANEVGKRLRNETGLRIGYHPEQADVAAGLIDPVMELTDPRYFDFVPDAGHLTAGGLDALEVYKKYRSRIITTHLRDYDPNAEFERNGQRVKGRFVFFGQGIINLRGLVSFLRQTDFTGQINAEGGGLAASRDYMREHLSLRL